MDLNVFLATQAWLVGHEAGNQQQGTVSDAEGSPGRYKRLRRTPFMCKSSFHISLSEQYTGGHRLTCWKGPGAKDAVFIRLNSSGHLSSQLDTCVYKQQRPQHHQGQGVSASAAGSAVDDIVVQWQDRQYSIDATGIKKVIDCRRACRLHVAADAELLLVSGLSCCAASQSLPSALSS